MALAALRSSRCLGSLVHRLRPGRRCISTATATAPAALEQDGPAPSLQQYDAALSSRRQALKQAKPFSDFLTDKYNRQHDYLRISVTERCNLRCLYCMPEEGVPLSPSSHLLTTPEIVYLSELFVSQGVTKIRLTGGEPTVRPDIVPLMQQIGSLKSKGLRELALTTNAISLHRKLDKMVEAGLTGVNISLDTLDPFQFQILTRRKGFDAVMKSIDRVLEMNSLGARVKLKVNCVVMRGINERELIPFVEMGREKDIEVRFIEYMPFGGNKWSERKMLTYQEMLEIIREKYPGLRSVKGHLNDTSKTYEIPGFVGKIGFITSMTHNFCGTCNRLRITSDGSLKVCLHGNTEVSLRDLLRKDNDDHPMDEQAFEAVREIETNRRQGLSVTDMRPSWIERETALLNLIGQAVKRKEEKHAGMEELQNMENRPMILIAEGRSPRRELGNSNIRPMGSTRLGQAVPLHLLQPNMPGYSGVRLYSSSSTSSSPPPFLDEQTAEEVQPNQTPALVTTATDGHESGFASLKGLFGAPRRSWSPPQTLSHEIDMVDDAQSNKLEQKIDDSSNNFIDGDPFEDHPNNMFLNAEKQHAKAQAHEMMSSASATKAQVGAASTDQSIQQPEDGEDASLMPKAIPEDPNYVDPSPHIPVRTRNRRGVETFRFGNTLEATNTTKAAKASEGLKTLKSKPKPVWKVGSDDIKLSSRPNQRADTSTMSPSTKPRQPVQGNAQPSRPLTTEKNDQSLYNQLFASSASPVDEPSSSQTSHPIKTDASLTHLTSTGEAHMVDVGQKESTERVAVAIGFVTFKNPEPYRLIAENLNKKGDVLGVARIAGIMAAKRCSDIIPLCHPIPITKITLDVESIAPQKAATVRFPGVDGSKYGTIAVEARVHTRGPTGVEMEALAAVSGACLTVYDMCKAVDKEMLISGLSVVYKAGGKSGDFLHSKWRNHPVDQKFFKTD